MKGASMTPHFTPGESTDVTVSHGSVQWAVGQGFFHSAWVNADTRTTHYVYDCGSMSNPDRLASEIDTFADGYDHAVEDRGAGESLPPIQTLLFISHFDADHINGLPRLFSRVSFDHIYIPLLSPAARLLSYVQSLVSTPSTASQDAAEFDAFHRRLTIDPRGTLSEFGTVTTIGVGDQWSDDEQASWDDDQTPYDADSPVISMTWDGHTRGPKLVVPPGQGSESARALDLWVWKNYVLSEVNEHRAQWLTSLHAALHDILPAAMSPADLDRHLRKATVIEYFIDHHVDKLKAAYLDCVATVGTKVGKMNLTSLSVYAGPPSSLPLHACVNMGFSGVSCHSCQTKIMEGQPPRHHIGHHSNPQGAKTQAIQGWLGLGDQDLSTTPREREIVGVFQRFARRIGIVALPHHGATSSRHPALLRDLVGEEHPVTCVVSSKPTYHNWGHPSIATRTDVANHGSHLACVNDTSDTRWLTYGSYRIAVG